MAPHVSASATAHVGRAWLYLLMKYGTKNELRALFLSYNKEEVRYTWLQFPLNVKGNNTVKYLELQ